MQSSLDYHRQAVELREKAAYAWLPSLRRRLLRRAADLESAGQAAQNVERLQRIARYDAAQAAPTPAAGVA